MRPTRILVVDDHALLREAVGMLLRRLATVVEITEAGTLGGALEQLKANGGADLVLLDLSLPDAVGINAIGTLHDMYPGLPVVVLSATDDHATVMHAVEAGAVGYVPKSSSANVMMAALRVVLGHGVYLPEAVIATESTPRRRSTDREEPPALDLTPRQMDVLRLILRGMSIKAIARALGITTSTAKAHTAVILRALNVTTRTQAVVEASRLGLSFGPDGGETSAAATGDSYLGSRAT